MWQAGRNTESAFTLLEVLIVLTILSLVGMAAALGSPHVRDRTKLVQAGAWLESTLINLRSQARREGRMTWANFHLAEGRYRLSDGGWHALPLDITWGIEAGHGPLATVQTVTFLPDGSGSGATFTIRMGVYSSVYQVDWLTGAIRHARP